jgi:thiol-disulfide isomerase/thioredoxin
MRRWLRVVLVAGVVILSLVAYMAYSLFLKPVKAQQLSLVTLDGLHVDLDSLVENKMTLVNFWATWCGPCIREMPLLDAVYARLDKDRWQVLLVSDETVDKIQAFKQAKPFGIPYLRHTIPLGDIDVAALPRSIVLDDRGNIVYSKTGELKTSEDALFEKLMSLDRR